MYPPLTRCCPIATLLDARKMHTSFLSACAGPLLLALAANAGANDDYNAPAPAPEYTGEEAAAYPIEIYPETDTTEMNDPPSSSEETTPSPVFSPTESADATAEPTDFYIETTDGGGEEKVPMGSMVDGGEDDREEMAMENPGDGESCSTYDEDVRTVAATGSY